ncbi:MAG: hypothetical protein AB1414_07140 [bacterium]
MRERYTDWKIFFIFYLPLAFITTYIHIRFTSEFGYECEVFGKPNGHSAIIEGQAFAPTQYRILMPFCAEFIHQVLNISIASSYHSLRVITTFLVLSLFHIYLTRWFDTPKALIGTLYLAGSIPLSYLYWPYPQDMFNLMMFIVGFIAIREHKDNWLYLILILGSLNYETIVFLILFYFFYHSGQMKFKKLIGRTISYLAIWTLVMVLIRLKYGLLPNFMDNQVHLIGYPMYQTNLKMYANIFKNISLTNGCFYIFLLFGFFWILAFLHLSKKPKFLVKTAWVIPIYLVFHFFIASFGETRVFLPLFLLLIPLGLFSIFKV